MFKGKRKNLKITVPDGVKFQSPTNKIYIMFLLIFLSTSWTNILLICNGKWKLHWRNVVTYTFVLGGGNAGYIQINDTDNWEIEMFWMMVRLKKDSKKIPRPNQDKMMAM